MAMEKEEEHILLVNFSLLLRIVLAGTICMLHDFFELALSDNQLFLLW